MTRKQDGRPTGHPEPTNISGSEPDSLGLDLGDAVDGAVADATAVAHARIHSTDSDDALVVSPA